MRYLDSWKDIIDSMRMSQMQDRDLKKLECCSSCTLKGANLPTEVVTYCEADRLKYDGNVFRPTSHDDSSCCQTFFALMGKWQKSDFKGKTQPFTEILSGK